MSKRKARPARETVSEQIRRHVRECGMTCYAIAKAAAIDESALSRFLSEERGISAKALDRLGALLDFEVVRHGPHE
jgi:DNA transposition AAA+ family ATPase